jgi:hypothetical protein
MSAAHYHRDVNLRSAHSTQPAPPRSPTTPHEFIDENGGGPGVRLKKPPKKRT